MLPDPPPAVLDGPCPVSGAAGLPARAAAFLLDPGLTAGRDEAEVRARLLEAGEEIRSSGTYRHRTAELVHGSRVAWRNHARCVGRLHWKALRVLDRREATTAEEVFQACVDHLRIATNGGQLLPVITVFAPRRPDGQAIRVWNPQLVRYAGYRMADGSVLGDPLHVEFTEAVRALGWRGPGGRFDVLPLVVSVPGRPPRWFDLPADAVLEVPISHPELADLAELGLRWHAVPAISDMRLEIGGVDYPACPFNGWYVGYEVGARNLADADRYDMLPRVAALMGLDTGREDSLWKDRALVELNRAVLHSFRQAGVHMVDHHTVTRQFVTHEERELRHGRTTPADRDWIVPPLSACTTPVFSRRYAYAASTPDFHRQPAAWDPSS
ncbi:nitric oxide synthase oxygenase [Streptomyces sp. SL13]|uniref:Nitric oxide synthase oxygenase n=1 Tax=Streptantibioticus silvisoli TaxID=2705255 RepID=A0AA90KI50_9ACTN|nr:nitric oxide synthase oxygenase [Streptantibioticus silvisoli]MDI5972615.1 nitric oxide synthase oxygenase [Streptantibioticus silvisoli]